MTPYTDMWKIHRKNITKIASTIVSLFVFDRIQEAESVHFLLNLLESPEQLFDHIRKEAGSVILKITYGYTTVARGNDPLVDLARKTLDQCTEAVVPDKWMVDILPFCKSSFFYHDVLRLIEASEIYSQLGTRNQLQGNSQTNGITIRTVYQPTIRVRQAANAREAPHPILPIPMHRKHRHRRRNGIRPQVDRALTVPRRADTVRPNPPHLLTPQT
jgi:hypothetical protein